MPDQSEVIASLTREQALERAQFGQLEMEYWLKVLDDLHEVNQQVHAIAGSILDSTGAVLGLLPLVTQAGTGSIETILTSNKAALKRLHELSATVDATLELIDGRGKVHKAVVQALAETLGVDLPDRGDQT